MRRRLLVAALAVVVLAAGAGAYVVFRRPSGGATVTVDIAPGSTTRQVAGLLKAKGVIGSAFLFRMLAKVRGIDGRIEAGRYDMRRGMGEMAALDVLSHRPTEKGTAITVPEGFTVKQISDRIGAHTQITAAEFLSASTDGSIRDAVEPPDVKTLEGLLFPETYFVGEKEDTLGVVRRMLDEFDARIAPLDWSYATAHALSRYQVVIVASLIEREAKLAQDRPKVAAVIYNRLAKHMRLQIDATAIYDLPQHKVPTTADLRRPSPYNTYLIDALPPTPIASPGIDALNAALHPAATSALFYVVCDRSGRECFTDSPQEFERLKRLRPPEVH